jgi:hypothetical protein
VQGVLLTPTAEAAYRAHRHCGFSVLGAAAPGARGEQPQPPAQQPQPPAQQPQPPAQQPQPPAQQPQPPGEQPQPAAVCFKAWTCTAQQQGPPPPAADAEASASSGGALQFVLLPLPYPLPPQPYAAADADPAADVPWMADLLFPGFDSQGLQHAQSGGDLYNHPLLQQLGL